MFFGYFLNIKKVTPSADFVIGPAKAEAFLFSHTRLPFPPRPLLPSGRISPAAKPGWPVVAPAGGKCSSAYASVSPAAKPRVRSSAPPFGFAAQKRARHFAARNHPVRLSASRPWLRHPAPLFCRSRHGCAAPGPQRQNPGLASIPSAYVLFFGAFFGAKMPLPGHAFAFLPAGASFRFVSPRGRGVRHPYGSSSAAAFMVAAPVTYTLPAFLNAPDSSTTALVLPFATFTTRSATP